MASRRLERKYQGVYKNSKSFARGFLIFLIACWMGFLSVQQAQGGFTVKVDFISNACLILLALLVFFAKSLNFLKWILCWLFLAGLLAYCVTGSITSLFTLNDENKNAKAAVIAINIFTICAELLTIFIYCLTHNVYPKIVKWGYLNPIWWWQLEAFESRSCPFAYHYLSKAWLGRKKKRQTFYKGQVNHQQQPHGLGKWMDTSFHGEYLEGYWENGIPIGPFLSREGGSGYTFRSIRIAFCSNRAEEKWNEIWFQPDHYKNGLKWGVSSVECSVSGAFFRFLPQVRDLSPNKTLKSAEDCFRFFLRPQETSASFYSQSNNEIKLSSRVQLFSSELSFTTSKEVVIFLHGFNCPLEYGLKRFAQLLCLSGMPSNLLPILFSWPSGSSLSYYKAKEIGAESEKTRKTFKLFLQSLLDAGVQKVNFLIHSMAARVFFNALVDFDDIFIVKEKEDEQDQHKVIGKLMLSTVVLLNPDYDLEEFVRFGGTFDLLYKYCHHITLYGDRQDRALWFAEMSSFSFKTFKVKKSLGREIRKIRRSANSSNKDLYDLEDFIEFNSIRSINSLDLDIIDTTWMDMNVHTMRHNYFNLNPTLVNDLFSVLVYKERAWKRKNLIKTKGEIYIFSVAPSYIMND